MLLRTAVRPALVEVAVTNIRFSVGLKFWATCHVFPPWRILYGVVLAGLTVGVQSSSSGGVCLYNSMPFESYTRTAS